MEDNIAEESWIYTYDLISKQQSTKWMREGQGPPKKGATMSLNKTMVITSLDYCGMISLKFHKIFFQILKSNPVDLSKLAQIFKLKLQNSKKSKNFQTYGCAPLTY